MPVDKFGLSEVKKRKGESFSFYESGKWHKFYKSITGLSKKL